MSDADRYRLRIVLQTVFRDLVLPEGRLAAAVAAKGAKMRRDAYTAVYRYIEAWLAGKFADGREFRVRLWADELRRGERGGGGRPPAGTYGVLVLDTTREEYRQLGYFTGSSPGAIAADLMHLPELAAAVGALPPDPHRRRQIVHVSFGARTFSAVVDRS